MGQTSKIKGERNRLFIGVPPSFVLDYYIWLDHSVLFHLSHFTDGKAEVKRSKMSALMSPSDSESERRLSQTLRLLVQCPFNYAKLLHKIFKANSFKVVFSRDERFSRKFRKRGNRRRDR